MQGIVIIMIGFTFGLGSMLIVAFYKYLFRIMNE